MEERKRRDDMNLSAGLLQMTIYHLGSVSRILAASSLQKKK
jgi:hypothetical protein